MYNKLIIYGTFENNLTKKKPCIINMDKTAVLVVGTEIVFSSYFLDAKEVLENVKSTLLLIPFRIIIPLSVQ